MKYFELCLEIYKINNNKQISYNYASFYYNKNNKSGNISPVANDEIIIIAAKTSMSSNSSPIGWVIIPHSGQ